MTKKSARGEFNSFVKGLITEASPLNFPEQAVRDINNFELNKDGSLNRRLGFRFEEGFAYIDLGISVADIEAGKLSSYIWEDPAGRVGDKFLVVQAGASLKIFNLNSTTSTLNGYLGSVTLPSPAQRLTEGSYAVIDGKLVISTGSSSVYVVSYESSFSISEFRLTTRDIWGVSYQPSDANPKNRPTVFNANHLYNLYNAGWGVTRRTSLRGTTKVISDGRGFGLEVVVTTPWENPASAVFTSLGFYPAEVDSVWSSIITVPEDSTPREIFSTDSYRATLDASSGTVRGSFIIDLLSRGSSRSLAIQETASVYPESLLKEYSGSFDFTEKGPDIVCEYAGRVFYAGFGPTVSGDTRSPDLSGYIAFSKLVNSTSDLGKCYQEGDPSSREAPDVIDTDGGLIRISGASGIKRLVALAESLIVFAENGVWVVNGGSDYGFTATNYKVSQISTFGVSSPGSVVSDGVRVVYWSEDSIYSIQKDQFGAFGYTSLSETSIKSFYESIDSVAKTNAKGVYDKVSKKIRWTYHPDGLFSGATKELVLDTLLGSYSINTYTNLVGTTLFAPFVGTPFINQILAEDVYAAGAQVVVVADPVVLNEDILISNLQSTKYVALINDGTVKMTIGWNRDVTFRDWTDVDTTGVDAKAFLLTGAMTAGDSSIHKQTPLLVMHMERTEKTIDEDFELNNQSSCKVRTMWDWATSSNSNKFGPLFEAYRYRRHYMPSGAPGEYDNGFELVTTRNKLRGRGRALSLYMETSPLKDCKIIGWNLSLNGNTYA